MCFDAYTQLASAGRRLLSGMGIYGGTSPAAIVSLNTFA